MGYSGKTLRGLWVAAGLGLLSGCGSVMLGGETAATNDASVPTEVREVITAPEPLEQPIEVEPALPGPTNLWAYIGQTSTWDIPTNTEVNAARERWLAQNGLFEALGQRATPALQFIVAETERRDLPVELALIPILESTLNPWAYSSQHAAGLWQINPPTAEHFGLTRTWWYDARYDIPVATETALDYLETLNKRFDGDWWLTLAAYNAGPNRVDRALKRSGNNDYWTLPLPPQTRQFVPKLLGLLSVLRDDAYNNERWPDTPITQSWVSVDTGGQIEIARAAELAGMDEETLRRMNPGILRWASPPDGDIALWVPSENAAALQTGLAGLPEGERVQWNRYEIQPGDSLIRIARRFDSQVSLIREVNGLSGNFIRAGDELLIPKGGNWSKSLQLASRNREARSTPVRYKVRRGDSLWQIARRYDLSVDNLVRWNALAADAYLQPGQTLKLRP